MGMKQDIFQVLTVLSLTSDKYLFQPYLLIPIQPQLSSSYFSGKLYGFCWEWHDVN